MYSILFIAATLLHLHLVFASPSLAVDDSLPAYGLAPFNPIYIESADCAQNDTACAANSSFKKRDFDGCPPGFFLSPTAGAFCWDWKTLMHICFHPDDRHWPRSESVRDPCPPGWRCVSYGQFNSTCQPPTNTLVWRLTAVINSDARTVFSMDPKIKSAVITNYYGPYGGPATIYHTDFVGKPKDQLVGSGSFKSYASSLLIDWTSITNVSIEVQATPMEAGATVVAFLSPYTYL